MRVRIARAWWVAGLAVGAGLLVIPPAIARPASKRDPSCSSGTTIFAQGGLRVFGGPYSADYGAVRGNAAYACLGAHAKPVQVGLTYGEGVGYVSLPRFAFDTAGYVAGERLAQGEGAPGEAEFSELEVFDLKNHRRISHVSQGGSSAERPWFRVSAAGQLAYVEAGTLEVLQAGARNPSALSAAGARASEPALVGNTVYWTEQTDTGLPAARSTELAGPSSGEAGVLEPVSFPGDHSRCARRTGTLIAASPDVRVLKESGASGRAFACRIGASGTVALPEATGAGARNTLRKTQIASNRWLMVIDSYRGPAGSGEIAAVIDMTSGRIVTTATSAAGTSIGQATLLSDGTMAWTTSAGSVLAQAPNTAAPAMLAPPGAGATSLADGGMTVYWTAGDRPYRWSAS